MKTGYDSELDELQSLSENAGQFLIDLEARETRLRDALSAVDDRFDYVLIDCPPALSLLTLNGFCAAEGVITASSLVGSLAGQPLSTLLDRIVSGEAYVNVHTTQFPPGEIRGQIR